ncbi:MAG: hypothetical protein GXO34_02520 [Deltaproteobacteria bacterium]|nr:hypothetical protein [Deltaproteobacteria bacterium]
MTTNHHSSTDFIERSQALEELLQRLESLGFSDNEHLVRWRRTLPELARYRSSFSLPLTCIGPVKSGKSTLINTLAGADLLPTGAGITTSFPTTVSAGRTFSARIILQPETAVKQLFSRAVALLFSEQYSDHPPLLEEAAERQKISRLLDDYRDRGNLTRHGIFNESYRLLRNLIAGADQVLIYYRKGEVNFTISDPQDQRYRTFIRDEALSPYLQEVAIQAPLKLLPPYLSLRDLPGLDTPNPSHQGIIIQQVSESPALIYVISSRIGLRQADYQLLEHLRRLGLETRLLFVLNLDLDEHRDRAAAAAMAERCRNELHELGFTQPLFAFSALALHFSQVETAVLSQADRQRLQRWREEKEKLAFSESGARDFLDHLAELGRNEAATALIEHSEKRLRQIIGGALGLVRSEIERLQGSSRKLAADRSQRQEERKTLAKLLKEIEHIIDGACNETEKYCFTRTSRWIERRDDSGLLRKLAGIVQSYKPPLEQLPEKYRNPLTPIKIINNHFQLTIPPRLEETTTVETLRFMTDLQQEINQRLLDGCTPLFVICERFSGRENSGPQDLPLPVRIDLELPAFVMFSEVEKRFALIDRIREFTSLWSRKLWNRRQSAAELHGRQLIKETLRELPRWLSNYGEQLKYAYLRRHLEECRKLIGAFFSDLLAGSGRELECGEEKSAENREEINRRLQELEKLAVKLGQMKTEQNDQT